MTKIINLYGGPGVGKSTSAAFMFYALKQQGLNVELVREYVKNWAWEKRSISVYDQLYFLGKQSRAESVLYSKVDYIITDSPVLLNVYYSNKYAPRQMADGICAAVRGFYEQAAKDGHIHHHVMLRRSKPYNPAGRFQNEGEAKEIDAELHGLLATWQLEVNECETDEFSLRQLVAKIVAR